MLLFIIDPSRRMAEERTRRLPKWLAVDNDETKKKMPGENKPRKDGEELPTQPRNSIPLAKKETKRKRGNLLKHSESSKAGVNVSRRNKTKQNAKDIASPPAHDHIEDEDDLTVDDLVSIAQEYVKGSEDSEQCLLLCGNGQPSFSNAKQNFSSYKTRVSSGSTVDSTSEQSFVRTDDPVLDMLRIFLGPLP